MLNLRKKTLALAVAAAATLGGGISAAQAQTVVSGNGYGQVVIYPYFTVRDGWRTFVPVSYTHLDVYKRQFQNLTPRRSPVPTSWAKYDALEYPDRLQ